MEKDRINDTEKSFLSGKKRMDKLKVLMKYAGISVFEYFPDSDRMVLYNEQLEEEKGIMPFLGQLVQIAIQNGHLCHVRRSVCDIIGGQPKTN